MRVRTLVLSSHVSSWIPSLVSVKTHHMDSHIAVSFSGWRHIIHIHFLPEKRFAVAYFRGKMNYEYYQMMMLMGRFHSFCL